MSSHFIASGVDRLRLIVDDLELPVLGRAELIANKRACGRPQDLADIDRLTTG